MTSSHLRRLLASAVLAFCGLVPAQAYTGLFVFGDSLSDSGNSALTLGADAGQTITGNSYIAVNPYASGVFSNGPTWTQQLAAQWGLQALPSLAPGGSIYAFGGARTSAPGPGPGGFPPSLSAQLAQFDADHEGAADAGALYVIAGGGPDVSNALLAVLGGADPTATAQALAQQYAADIGTLVDGLQDAGAQHIVVWNTPNFGLTPLANSFGPDGAALATGFSLAMNAALGARLSLEPGSVRSFDVFGLLSSVVSQPGAWGFTNVTDACGAAALGCDPATALFYDGVHPTSAAHAILAGSMAQAVPEPASAGLFALGLGGLWLLARRRRAGTDLNRPS